MGMSGLHGIPNLQHNDVLEKLKMQVRDMKVGLMVSFLKIEKLLEETYQDFFNDL